MSAKPGQPKKMDYENERGGIANIFINTEPLGSCVMLMSDSAERRKIGHMKLKIS